MADRRIAIRVTVENRDAVRNISAQTAATRGLSDVTHKHTHLQNGLTNSFIKGNLAARAISVAYLTIRDSMKAAFGQAVMLEHVMMKMAAVTDANGNVMRSMGSTISDLADATKMGHNELAKTALEMSKMGLSAAQAQIALGGVAKLARALDENLVRTGEAVVAVLNTYGLSAEHASKVTNQLAFTVKASALDIEQFRTAFSYVGGTAAAAGVSLSELQGAMDVLSNSGIRSSTIGTQLRRVIAELSNENSKAAKVLGGKTLQSYGSLEKTLDALAQKNLSASNLTQIFGRTASSVAAILIKYRDVMGDLGKQTENVGNIVDGMTQKMNTTFKSSIDSVKVSWTELGMQVMQSAGLMKAAVNQVDLAIRTLAERMDLKNQVKRFEKENFPGFVAVTQDVGTHDQNIAQHPIFQKWLQLEREAQAKALRVENIIDELKNTLSRDMAKLKAADGDVQNIPIENTFLFKKLAQEYAGAGHSKSEFLTKLSMARDKLLRELAPVNEGAEGLDDLLGNKKIKSVKSYRTKAPLSSEGFGMPSDSAIRSVIGRVVRETNALHKAEDKAANSMAKFAENMGRLQSTSDDRISWLEDMNGGLIALRMSTEAVNGPMAIFSSFLVEGIFSDKKDPFKGISDAFGDFAKKMAADLVALTLKILFFKGALALLTGGGFTGAVPFVSALASAAVPGFKFASGTDQVVDRPTLFMAGEAGRERVSVTPRAKMGSSGGAKIVVNIQGDVYGGEKFKEAVGEAEKRLNRSRV